MSAGRILAGIGITISGGVVFGTLGAAIGGATGAASGATGAAILTAAGHAGHSVHNSTVMSAAGNAIVTGGLGALAGLGVGVAAASRMFHSGSDFDYDSKHKDNRKSSCCGTIVGHVASQLIGGMVGYGVLMHAIDSIEPFGNYVADVAVGAAVTAIPMSIGLVCALGILLALAAAVALLAAKAIEACDSPAPASPRPGV